eukprot:NODE_570_length_5905_cov_0.420944.p5 type:complete len:160 gc:universal NODE_570_length_5905_cov_0.420944:4746-5225(+)
MNFNSDFVDVLNSLPNEIVSKLTTLKEKDAIGNQYFDELEQKTKNIIDLDEKLSDSDTTKLYDLFKRTLTIYEEKVAISSQMHDLVESNIRRIDEDLQRMSANDNVAPTMHIEVEQKYCYCQQPASGEMVGCDADNCPIEWFHLGCTNLIKIPTGKNYL